METAKKLWQNRKEKKEWSWRLQSEDPGSGGSPSACGGHCYGQRCPVRSRTSRPRSATRRTSGETPQSCHGILRQSLSRN